jgi:hypothetical protein
MVRYPNEDLANDPDATPEGIVIIFFYNESILILFQI